MLRGSCGWQPWAGWPDVAEEEEAGRESVNLAASQSFNAFERGHHQFEDCGMDGGSSEIAASDARGLSSMGILERITDGGARV